MGDMPIEKLIKSDYSKLSNLDFIPKDVYQRLYEAYILQLKEAENLALMAKEARIDPLTRLDNKRSLDELLLSHTAKAVQNGSELYIAMSDIDYFKSFNQAYGHTIGDLVLRSVAHRMLSSLRSMDVVGRYGGEEFTYVIPATRVRAEMILERNRASVQKHKIRANGQPQLQVTVTYGATGLDNVPEALILFGAEKRAGYENIMSRLVRYAPDYQSKMGDGELGVAESIYNHANNCFKSEFLSDMTQKRWQEKRIRSLRKLISDDEECKIMAINFLYTAADMQLLLAKSMGKNCVIVDGKMITAKCDRIEPVSYM